MTFIKQVYTKIGAENSCRPLTFIINLTSRALSSSPGVTKFSKVAMPFFLLISLLTSAGQLSREHKESQAKPKQTEVEISTAFVDNKNCRFHRNQSFLYVFGHQARRQSSELAS